MSNPTKEAILTEQDVLAALQTITYEAPSRLPPGWLKFAREIEAKVIAALPTVVASPSARDDQCQTCGKWDSKTCGCIAATPSVQGESIKHDIEFKRLVDARFNADTLQGIIATDRALVEFLDARLARTAAPSAQEHRYATQLATALWEKHYKTDAPQWKVLPDLYGALSQIDNMTCRLIRADGLAAPSEGLAIPANNPVIQLLLEVVRCAFHAMDNTEDDGNGKHWNEPDFDALSNALDALDALPDDRPGYVMGPAAKAEWALRAPTTEQAKPELAGLTDLRFDLFEAIKIAHFRAEHAGASNRMKKWDAVRDALEAILAAQPVPQASGERDAPAFVPRQPQAECESVRICLDLDRECGHMQRSWCLDCPKWAATPSKPTGEAS